jgi:hypothetical protein
MFGLEFLLPSLFGGGGGKQAEIAMNQEKVRRHNEIYKLAEEAKKKGFKFSDYGIRENAFGGAFSVGNYEKLSDQEKYGLSTFSEGDLSKAELALQEFSRTQDEQNRKNEAQAATQEKLAARAKSVSQAMREKRLGTAMGKMRKQVSQPGISLGQGYGNTLLGR